MFTYAVNLWWPVHHQVDEIRSVVDRELGFAALESALPDGFKVCWEMGDMAPPRSMVYSVGTPGFAGVVRT